LNSEKMSDHKPLIVQADRTVLLETSSPAADAARYSLCRFAELESAAEYMHVFRITPISLWNAAALGYDPADVKIDLGRYSRYPLPPSLLEEIDDVMGRYGRLRLVSSPVKGELFLDTADPELADQIESFPSAVRFLVGRVNETRFRLKEIHRGEIKWALIMLGYPVEDRAGFREAPHLPIRLRDPEVFRVRDYQRQAASHFLGGGAEHMGHGVVVLPCGAGKTIVGMVVMAELSQPTLILVTSNTACDQWIAELLEKTDLPKEMIGRYTGSRKEVRPVTVATYHVLSRRLPDEPNKFPHIERLAKERWGLVIYDEVHLLPAPIFRFTAAIQGTRRLGLTATLVREDNKETDVFSLIGPKRYDAPWRFLEERRWIAQAYLREIRVPMSKEAMAAYAQAPRRAKFRIAAENPCKIEAVKQLVRRHRGEPTLIVGHYLRQVRKLAKLLGAPLITGDTPQAERNRLYEAFRRGEIELLVVSRVANFAVDLPLAAVAIEVSGLYGSRQEEAQRLGRILRPKDHPAFFYTVISQGTVEQDFAWQRQRFLVEQGYEYEVLDFEPDK